jgi:DsbC/DsbD-like thiol-disulfide interchange protein
VRAWLDSPTYAFFQRLHVNVEVSVASGFHLYGRPVPAGLVPLSLEVAPIEGVEIGDAEWPAPHPVDVPGLDEHVLVHEGTVRGTLPLTFSAPPGAGDHTIRSTVSYQACSDSVCLAPMSLALSFPVREVALEGRQLPGT